MNYFLFFFISASISFAQVTSTSDNVDPENSVDNLSEKDSLEAVAKQVYISEKLEKLIDLQLIDDEPNFSNLNARIMSTFQGISPLSMGVEIGADYQFEKVNFNTTVNKSFYNLIELDYGYYDDGIDITAKNTELALPNGGENFYSIEIGASYVLSTETKKINKTHVYKLDYLGSTQTTESYLASTFDHPVTYVQSSAIRGGVIVSRRFTRPDEGDDFEFDTIDPIPFRIKHGGGANINEADGYLAALSRVAFLGYELKTKVGYHFELKHIKSGTDYTVKNYFTDVKYIDLLYLMDYKFDDVLYRGNSYKFYGGSEENQVDVGRSFGARIGWKVSGAKGINLPYGLEVGLFPFRNEFYFKLGVGIGYTN